MEAVNTPTWVMVSVVPPLVHEGAVPVRAIWPPDAAANVTALRVVLPAEALTAPEAPGSPVKRAT